MKVQLSVLSDGVDDFVQRVAALADYIAAAPDEDPILKLAVAKGEIDISIEVEIASELRDGVMVLQVKPTGALAEVLAAFEAQA